MALAIKDVRAALAAVIKANLDGYDVLRYEPDNPPPRSAWIWIDEVNYRDDDAVGGGYQLEVDVRIQLPRTDPREAQAKADELMDQDTGFPSWIAADTTLNADLRIAIVERASLGFNEVDDATFAVVMFKLTIFT